MVAVGECYITKYGSIHKEKQEAVQAEIIEDQKEFCKRVKELAVKAGRTTLTEIQEASKITYWNAGIIIQTMREFGMLPSEPITSEPNLDNVQTEELKEFWQHAVYFSQVCAGIAAKIPDLPVSHIEQVALEVYKYSDIFKEAMIVTKIFDDY